MTKSSVYYWPPSTVEGFTDDIALNQDALEDSNLILVSNTPWGVFSYININTPQTTTSGVSTDIIRSISITSEDDNSGVTFVISGIGVSVDGDGNPTSIVGPITEELVGPDSDTVTSVNIYTIINSITATRADAINVSVGYGPNGITSYIYMDTNRNLGPANAPSYTLKMLDNEGLTASTYFSLNKPQTPNIYGGFDTYGVVNGVQGPFIPAFSIETDLTEDTIFTLHTVYSVFWVQVANCTTDSMFLTFDQPGI